MISVRSEVLLLHDVGNDIGVDRAAACSHYHTLERGESHRSVDALAIKDGGNRAAVSDVAGDDLAVIDIQASLLGSTAADVVV